MARVQNLFRASKKHLPMEELSEVRAVVDTGFEGCAHARSGRKRQVLLVDRETLEAMDLTPGIIRENITTDGLNVNSLEIGQLLRAGEARLEVSAICAVGTAGHAVPRAAGWSDPPRRFHRKALLT